MSLSPTLRRQQLEAALEALKCAESNLDAAQEFADCVGDRPDVDACMELAIVLIQQARGATRWAVTLFEDGVAAKAAAVSVKITLELEPNHAAALLRLCNKITHSDALAYLYPHVPRGVRNDQAYDVIHATTRLAEALCDNGANEFPWIESGSAE